jgi:hypothetical protein
MVPAGAHRISVVIVYHRGISIGYWLPIHKIHLQVSRKVCHRDVITINKHKRSKSLIVSRAPGKRLQQVVREFGVGCRDNSGMTITESKGRSHA